ncbi:MAG: hypothetical protein ABEJ43_01785 [Haloferacaceae archaeon]
MILFVPFGPRLDRPDGVGDEGRPRAGGLFAATLVAGAGLFATATLAGLGSSANLAATGAGFAVAGVALFDRDEPLVRAGAHLLFLPGLLLALAGVASGVLAPDPFAGVGVTLGVTLGVVGGGAAWAGVLGDGEAREAATQGAFAAVVPLVVAVPLLVVLGVLAVVSGSLLGGLGTEGPPRPASFALLLALAAGALRLALWALPLARLVDRERRAAVAGRLALAGRALTGAAALSLLGWLGFGVAGLLGATARLWAALPPTVVRALALATGAPVRVPVALVGSVAFVLAVGSVIVRRLAGQGSEWLGGSGLPFVGGAVLLVVVSPVLVVLAATRADRPVTVGLGVLLVVLATVALAVLVGVALVGLSTLPVAVRVGLLPARTGGVALLAAGTLLVAGFGGLAGAPVLAVVGTTAAALVAWDLGSFAATLTAEVGHRPAVRALSRRRALASVGVGVAGGGLALGAGTFGGVAGVGLLPAAALAVGGAVPLLLSLRA